jgi:hypothetical protein
MGWLDDAFKQVSEIVVNTVNTVNENLLQIDPNNLAVDNQALTEIDPTNPDAEFGEETRIVGDLALNIVTEGGAGTVFSDGSEFIQDLNDVTDNTFTINNIEDIVSDF